MRSLARPPEKLGKAVGLLLTDAKLAKVPLTVLSFILRDFETRRDSMYFIRKKNGSKVYGPIPLEKITHGLASQKLLSDDCYAKTKQGPWIPLSRLLENDDEEDEFFDSIKSQAKSIKSQQQTNSPLKGKQQISKQPASTRSFSFPNLGSVGLTQDILAIYLVSIMPWIPLYFLFPQLWPLFVLLGILLILSFFQFVLLYAVSDSLILLACLAVPLAVGNGVVLCLISLSLYEQRLYGFSIIPKSVFWLAVCWQIIACGFAVKKLVDDAVPVLWPTFYNWVAQIVLVLAVVFLIMPLQSSYLMFLVSGHPVYLSGDEIFPKDGLNTKRIEKNKQLPPSQNAASLAKIFSGTWIVGTEAEVASALDGEATGVEIDFSFGPLRYNHGYFRYAAGKPAASFFQSFPMHAGEAEWKIRSVKQCYDGSYHVDLCLEGKAGSQTLPVQNLTRNSFTVDVFSDGRFTLFGVKR